MVTNVTHPVRISCPIELPRSVMWKKEFRRAEQQRREKPEEEDEEEAEAEAEEEEEVEPSGTGLDSPLRVFGYV